MKSRSICLKTACLGNSLLRSIGADKRDSLLHELIKLPAGVDAADERLVGGSGRRGRRRARFEGLAEPPEEGRRASARVS